MNDFLSIVVYSGNNVLKSISLQVDTTPVTAYRMDLKDALVAMNLLTEGVPTVPFYKVMDVDKDRMIGLMEVLFILQNVAGDRL